MCRHATAKACTHGASPPKRKLMAWFTSPFAICRAYHHSSSLTSLFAWMFEGRSGNPMLASCSNLTATLSLERLSLAARLCGKSLLRWPALSCIEALKIWLCLPSAAAPPAAKPGIPKDRTLPHSASRSTKASWTASPRSWIVPDRLPLPHTPFHMWCFTLLTLSGLQRLPFLPSSPGSICSPRAC